MQLITLTDKAAEKAKYFLEKESKSAIRLDVKKGGCSGFMYDITLENQPQEEDIETNDKGIKIYLGKEGKDFIKGSTVDYFQSLQDSGFKIENPNVKKECGCGHSIG
tara:strand:+ start:387 stop:707 length:321 start_codon:yes stop_codon:yes gene_type:complete